MKYFAKFEKFIPHSVIMPSFMTIGSQMPELDRGAFVPPPYKIGCQNTPYKLGLKDSGRKLKGELQRENKLISYERGFKMLENDMCITVIGQAVLELLGFEIGPGNHQTGISLPQKFSEIFGNMRLISPKMKSYLRSHDFQVLEIEIFSKPCKI